MVIFCLIMSEELQIRLRYSGPGVDNGSMQIDEVADALHGFSAAYGKIAARYSGGSEHQLKVSAINAGSFELAIAAATLISTTPYTQQLEFVEQTIKATKFVYGILTSVLKLGKHAHGKPFEVSVNGNNNNTLVVINAEGSTLSVPQQALEVYREKLV